MIRFIRSLSGENSVRGASLILIVTLTISNILGLLRDRLLNNSANYDELGLYFAAFRIPDTVFNFLILGAITSAFIPVFSELVTKKEKERAYKVASTMINLGGILMVVTAIVFYFFMPRIVPALFPGFSLAELHKTIRFSQLLMITPIFFAFSYIFSGVLNSYGRFLAFALSPLLYNLSIIIGALWAVPRFGIEGAIYFVIIGSFLHAAIQVPALLKTNFKYTLSLDLQDEALKTIGKLMIPRSLSLGANQVLLTVYTAIGALFSTSAIAAFNFANNIQTVPTVILGNSFATAVFPTLARKITENDKEGFRFYLVRVMRVIGFLLIPSTIAFILLRAQIVRLVIGTSRVNWEDTKVTAVILACFAISFLAQGLIPLLARAFFALKNTKLPMYISIATVVFSILLAFPLTRQFSVAGLPLAFSIGSYLQLILLLFFLNKVYPGIVGASLFLSYLKTGLISIIAGGFIWITMHLMADIVDMRTYLGVFIQTVIALSVGLISYVVMSLALGLEEAKWAISRKINGKPPAVISEQLPQ